MGRRLSIFSRSSSLSSELIYDELSGIQKIGKRGQSVRTRCYYESPDLHATIALRMWQVQRSMPRKK